MATRKAAHPSWLRLEVCLCKCMFQSAHSDCKSRSIQAHFRAKEVKPLVIDSNVSYDSIRRRYILPYLHDYCQRMNSRLLPSMKRLFISHSDGMTHYPSNASNVLLDCSY
jgi:hypothetical protein